MEMLARKPCEIILRAVKRMMPRGPLWYKQLYKMKIEAAYSLFFYATWVLLVAVFGSIVLAMRAQVPSSVAQHDEVTEPPGATDRPFS